MDTAYKFQYAWLGGETLESDVTIKISDGRITAVSRDADDGATPIAGVALPGLVSAHSHLFHRSLRGRTHTQGGDFWAWREPMYELANTLDPDSYFSLACEVFNEMLRSGYTTVGEFHYLHHQPDGTPYEDPNTMGKAVIAAARATGIRLTLLDTIYLTSNVDGSPPLPHQLRFSDGSADIWAERVSNLDPDDGAQVGVAAHSVRAVPPAALQIVRQLGSHLSSPVHVHVSEQPAENEACVQQQGVTPIQLLGEYGLLAQDTTLVHATHVDEEDRQRIATSGASVCFCPTTEADLGDGIGPATEYSVSGVKVSLGSDSNAVIDPFLEMRQLEYHDRLRLQSRGLHSPRQLLEYATVNGAESLGWDSGELAAGRLADIVVADLQPEDEGTGPGMIAFGTTAANVSKVMVGGKMVMT